MSQNQPSDDNQNSHPSAKIMVVLAWICAIGLLTYGFNDLLSKQANPNTAPQSFRDGTTVEVRLKRNRHGHYVTTGTINGVTVEFMVDTGATDVSVPAHLARQLNLKAGRAAYANTANGTVRIAQSSINQLTIGDMVLYNVDANLNPGMQGDQILLGMSVLKQLEFTQRGDWLYLRTL